MTFCAVAKTEITQVRYPSNCCSVSHLYGMLLFARIFSPSRIALMSEHGFVIPHVCRCLEEFGIAKEHLEVSAMTRGDLLQITDRASLERIFIDFGYTGEEPNLRIVRQNFLCEQCAPAFVAGCFLTGGNLTDPGKGYHLEFSTHKFRLLGDLNELLVAQDAGFEPRMTTRGSARVLYYKNSEQIEDMLTWMGAVRSSLDMMNTKIVKDIANTRNRRANCESANSEKTVSSAARDREAIETIYRLRGEASLPEDLVMIARLRLNNPDMPLAQLGAMLEHPLTKSGVNHRLRRLRSEAEALREQSGRPNLD